MKNSPTTAVLLGILCFSVLGSVILCYLNIKCSRELRQLQAQAGGINNNRAIVQALINDTIEYSKKNPAIDPVLESVGLKPKPGSAASKPASK